MARWRVAPGATVGRNGAAFGPGEEFDAPEGESFDGLAELVDKPKPKAKDDD